MAQIPLLKQYLCLVPKSKSPISFSSCKSSNTAACDSSGGIQHYLSQPGNLKFLHNQLIAKYLLFCSVCISWFKKLRHGSQAVRGHQKRKTVKIQNTNQNNTGDVNVVCLPSGEPKKCPGELASTE